MQPFHGILFKLASVACLIVMAAIVKSVSDTVPPGEAVFFRSFFSLPVIFVWLLWVGDLRGGLKVQSPMAHVFRGLVGTTAMGMFFAALRFLPLPETTAIGYTAPLLVVVFAAMFLGEKVGWFRLTSVAVGMVGVMIVLSPRLTALDTGVSDRETLGALLMLMSTFFAALVQVFIRRMVATETTSAIVFWFSITGSAVSLLTLPYGWVWPSPTVFALLVATGLIGGLGQIFLTSAYRFADASLVAPFEYASMLLSLIVGYAVFGEVPTGVMLAGSALIICAGVAIILRERYLGIQRGKARQGMSNSG